MTNSEQLSDIELEAASYVLGLSRGAERLQTQQRMSSNQELREWINWWQQRLAPLALNVVEAEPNKTSWKQIKQRLNTSQPNNIQAAAPVGLAKWFSGALAAVLLITFSAISTLYISQRHDVDEQMPTHYASLQHNGMISHIVERYANGDIVCIAVKPADTEGNQVLELWALIGDQAPLSLGVLPDSGSVRMPGPAALRQVKGQVNMAMSIEPFGGSPTGQPTGPVVHSTALLQRNASQSFSF